LFRVRKINDQSIGLDKINLNSKNVCIAGEVFFIDTRQTKTGRLLYIFDVTDKKNSIRVKKLLGKKSAQKFLENI
jgi:DNA polymerase-3 subunit alpha (Gram-positive type)